MITNEQARVAALASHVAYDNLGAYVELVGAGYEYVIDFDDPDTGFHAAILQKSGTNEYRNDVELQDAATGLRNKTRPSGCSGLLQHITNVALAIALLGSVSACGSNNIDSIIFDQHKSKQLSQDQNNAYNVQLFNQLLVRGELPLDKRYRLLKSMAENGHELSYLALKLYDIRYSDLRRNDPEALERIVELAENGDAAAKCFYAEYFLPYEPSPELKKKLDQYVEAAADGGIPRCMAIHSASDAIADGDKIYWNRQAAIKGDLRAQSRIAMAYFLGNDGMPKDLDRAVCWLREAEKSGSNEFGSGLRLSIDPMRKTDPNPDWCKSVVSNR